MTKSEYMEALQNKLECFNRELQQEIVEDYEQHFAEGIAAGKTEEEIVAELGSIEDMIQELPEEESKQGGFTIQAPDGTKDQMSENTEIRVSEEEEESDASITYTGEYKAIVIDGVIADVSLEQSLDGKIQVEYHNNGDRLLQQKYRFYQYEEDGVFYVGIKADERVNAKAAKRAVKIMLFGKSLDVDLANFDKTFNHVWNSGSDDISLDIKIPAGMPRVEVKTLSGDIDVRDVTPVKMDINSTSGDIEIRHVTVDRLKLNTVSGDITGTHIYSADTDVNTASGDIELEDSETGRIRLQSASGDITGSHVRGNAAAIGTGSGDVDFTGCFERYSVKTGSGDVDLKPEAGAKDVRVGTGSGDAEVNLTALEGAEITVNTGSGEAAIYGPGNVRHQVTRGTCTVGNGDCKVRVNTGSGDAEVRCR